MIFRYFVFTFTMLLPEKQVYRILIPDLTPGLAYSKAIDKLGRYLHYNCLVPENITIRYKKIKEEEINYEL